MVPGDVVVDVGANLGFLSLLMGLLGFELGENYIPHLIPNIAPTRLENIDLVEKPPSSAAGNFPSTPTATTAVVTR
jgi:hypothetical protein